MTGIHKAQVGTAEKTQLLGSLGKLRGKKVLIVGDVGLDEYVMGEVRRISPEAPVPVVEVTEEDMRLGLAANVAQNVASLGGEALLVGVVGRDTGASMLQELYHKAKVSWDHMIIDDHRPTTRKTRVMAKHHHIVRVDYEMRKYLSPEVEAKVLKQVVAAMPEADAVILQDYAKGVISQTLVKAVAAEARKQKKLCVVDPHRSNPAEFYHGVDLIKPNYDESLALSGLKFDELRENPNMLFEVGKAIQKKTGAKEVVLTRGKDGMLIFSGDDITEVPTFARKVFDVTGAGDTVIAALSLGLAGGLSLVQSSMLANFAAGVVVGKVGCVPCEIPELQDYIQSAH